jgi:hypothetical protein
MSSTGSMQSLVVPDNHLDQPGAGISTSASPAETMAHGEGASCNPAQTTMTETQALRLEVATYITQMSAELSAMARSSEFALLSYFLDMAAAESRENAEKLSHIMGDGSSDQPRIPKPDQTLT